MIDPGDDLTEDERAEVVLRLNAVADKLRQVGDRSDDPMTKLKWVAMAGRVRSEAKAIKCGEPVQ